MRLCTRIMNIGKGCSPTSPHFTVFGCKCSPIASKPTCTLAVLQNAIPVWVALLTTITCIEKFHYNKVRYRLADLVQGVPHSRVELALLLPQWFTYAKLLGILSAAGTAHSLQEIPHRDSSYRSPPAVGAIEMALTKPENTAGLPSLNHTNSSASSSTTPQPVGYLFLVGNTACMVRWEGQLQTR